MRVGREAEWGCAKMMPCFTLLLLILQPAVRTSSHLVLLLGTHALQCLNERDLLGFMLLQVWEMKMGSPHGCIFCQTRRFTSLF